MYVLSPSLSLSLPLSPPRPLLCFVSTPPAAAAPAPRPRDWALDPHRIRRRARRHSPRRLPVSLRPPVPVAAPAAGGFLPAPAFPTFLFPDPGPGSRVPDFARSCGGRCPRPPPWRRRDPARAWQ
ncbi:hypothetical protein SORBI_3008G174850 [Sorghum bicolor]|uniref:Uncharacterized protein n=1 Tax=Sorghum bicolor TaxID=4558 RepID=A0A1Z5R7E1_SORBI|nr:hypothetical protein SORBI_3008G174850 [Sorghum bicolor]